ncbi:hypothetical protein B0H10DRAFT_2197280 [Mycena sp. CBHHK59/15]|nr:hypothetical protein B0H10DRAFT_2197280 [Mycena sp. CBHHK59/15]
MEAPGLKTRAQNKDVHPGVKAGVDKKVRRTKAKMAQARDDEATAKALAVLNKKTQLKRLAALEDQQHRDDIAYAATANHPVDKPVKANIPAVVESGATPQPDSGSGDDSDAYQQPDDSEEESDSDNDDDGEDDDADADADDSDADVPKKKQKKKTTSRADIIASRTTQDSTGTPHVEEPSTGQKRKAGDGFIHGRRQEESEKRQVEDIGQQEKSGLDNRGSKSQAKDAASAPEDDLMVAPGGPALDDDEEEHVEKPQKGKKKKGMPNAPPIVIKHVAPEELTGKAVRGGDAKWALKHLPPDAAEKFTNEVVPLARGQAGVGAVSPWGGLTVAQIQAIVDKVYGAGVHIVKPKDVWVGLAEKGVKLFITTDDGEDEDEEEENADDIPPVDGTVADPTLPAGTGPAARQFSFKTPAGIAEFVEWALQLHKESDTMAFHWKQWGEGADKQGFLQADLILYVYAYQLSCLETIPAKYTRLTAAPITALLLAVQAVQWALQFWRTGVYNKPATRTSYFSSDNWDDYTIPNPNPHGKKDKLVRRATKYLASVKKWDQERWDEITVAAKEYMDAPSRRRAASSSRSASEAGDDMFSDDDESLTMSLSTLLSQGEIQRIGISSSTGTKLRHLADARQGIHYSALNNIVVVP